MRRLDHDGILDAWFSSVETPEIAARFGTTPGGVARVLAEARRRGDPRAIPRVGGPVPMLHADTVLDARAEGLSIRALADRFGADRRTVMKLVARAREAGDPRAAPRPSGSPAKGSWADYARRLAADGLSRGEIRARMHGHVKLLHGALGPVAGDQASYREAVLDAWAGPDRPCGRRVTERLGRGSAGAVYATVKAARRRGDPRAAPREAA